MFSNSSVVELGIYLALAALVYLALRKLSRVFFPYMLSKSMLVMHQNVKIKKALFDEAFGHVKSTKKLEVLEIGIGTGCNFTNFPRHSNLTILDKSDQFLPYLKQSIEKENRHDLTISKLVVNPGEDMKGIASNSMDAVVHTFVMCSVDDIELVLKEIYRVLKPGGVNIFIEHSLDETTWWRWCFQMCIQLTGLVPECKYKPMRKLFEKHNKCEKLILKDYYMSESKFIQLFNPILCGYSVKSESAVN